MRNCNKIRHTCGSENYAICTHFEGTPNTDSSLTENSCISVEEALQDIYDQVGNHLDLSELGQSCLEYVEEDGKLFVKNVLLKLEQEICDLKERVADLEDVDICNKDITSCELNFGDLVDACGNTPQTIAEVLQLLLNQNITP